MNKGIIIENVVTTGGLTWDLARALKESNAGQLAFNRAALLDHVTGTNSVSRGPWLIED